MQCVWSTRLSLILGGLVCSSFKPTRGLKQGDPLSPYLFILVSEALSRLIMELEATGQLKGIKLARSCPTIYHFLFADDSLFFINAEPSSINILKNILIRYNKAIGERINFENPPCSLAVIQTRKLCLKLQRFLIFLLFKIRGSILEFPWFGRNLKNKQ